MDIDTDTNTQLTEAEVAAAAIVQGFVTGAHTVDTDTQLTAAEVAAAAIAQGFVSGAHTVDTDTQLTNAQVVAAVRDSLYVTSPGVWGTNVQANCNPGDMPISGSCETNTGTVHIQSCRENGNGWRCLLGAGNGHCYVRAKCLDLTP